jgi:LPS export ABC transporter protein LptC
LRAIHPWSVLAGAVCTVLAACQPEETGETAGPALLEMQADQVIIGMDYTITSDGLRRGRLLADTAYYFDGEAEIQLRKVFATFYDTDGAEVSRLESKAGVFYTETEDMEATGRVVVIDLRENQRLTTESLFYSARADLISTDADFVLQQGSTTFRGTGFSSDPGMNRTQMNQPSGVSQGMRQPVAGAPAAVPETRDTGTVLPDSMVEGTAAPADSTGTPPETSEPTVVPAVIDTSSVPADTGRAEQDTLRSSGRMHVAPRPPLD